MVQSTSLFMSDARLQQAPPAVKGLAFVWGVGQSKGVQGARQRAVRLGPTFPGGAYANEGSVADDLDRIRRARNCHLPLGCSA